MCTEHKTGQFIDRVDRRSVLKASGAIAAMTFIGVGALSSIATPTR